MHLFGCARFWLWTLAGGLATFSVVASASIGFIFVVPTLVALWLAFRAGPAWPEGLGSLVGAAGVCFTIAVIQRGHEGLDARPWLIAAILLALAGVAGYAVLSRRPRRGLRA
jgi:hypothetical protein